MQLTDMHTFRERLLALRERLIHDLSGLQEETLRSTGGEASGSLSNVPLHPADLGSDAYEEELNFNLVGNDERTLDDVNHALERLEEGTFGRCERCGRDIVPERLHAALFTRYCRPCAEASEKEQPQ